MREDLIGFFTTQPQLAWLLTIAILACVIGVACALRDLTRQRREDEARARARSIEVASQVPPPPQWPRPAGPKGWHSRNGSTA